jgi:hypothetical protein
MSLSNLGHLRSVTHSAYSSRLLAFPAALLGRRGIETGWPGCFENSDTLQDVSRVSLLLWSSRAPAIQYRLTRRALFLLHNRSQLGPDRPVSLTV